MTPEEEDRILLDRTFLVRTARQHVLIIHADLMRLRDGGELVFSAYLTDPPDDGRVEAVVVYAPGEWLAAGLQLTEPAKPKAAKTSRKKEKA